MSDIFEQPVATPASAPAETPTTPAATESPSNEALSSSMDETLKTRMAELNAEDGGEVAEAPAEPTEGRLRGPDGKFLPKAAAVEPAAAESAPTEPAAGEFVDHGPPSGFRPGAKAEWETLSPSMKAEVYKREEDFHRGLEQYKAKAQVGEILAREIMPFEAQIRASGTDVPGAVRSLFSAAASLQMGSPAQKAATLRGIAQTFGVDLNQLAGQQDASQQQFVDPAVEELKQRLYAAEQREAARVQAAQQQEYQGAASLLEQFASDPQHKYFEDVRGLMGQLIMAGQAASLPQAYEMACRTHPQVFEALQAETRQREEKARAEQAAKARKLGNQGLRPTPTPGQPAQAHRTMDDTLRDAYREIQSR